MFLPIQPILYYLSWIQDNRYDVHFDMPLDLNASNQGNAVCHGLSQAYDIMAQTGLWTSSSCESLSQSLWSWKPHQLSHLLPYSEFLFLLKDC